MHDGTGELAVSDFELGAQHVLDTEVARQRLDLITRCRRHQSHGVPLAEMRLDQSARFGINAAGQTLGEDPATGGFEVGFGAPAHNAADRGHEPRKVHLPALEP